MGIYPLVGLKGALVLIGATNRDKRFVPFSSSCRHYPGLKVSFEPGLKVSFEPGLKLFVDEPGPKIALVVDRTVWGLKGCSE
jgi:hypothetical protein